MKYTMLNQMKNPYNWSLIVLFYVLSLINNYFFYDHIERVSKRDVRNIAYFADRHMSVCMESNTEKYCFNKIDLLIKEAAQKYYITEIQIQFLDNTLGIYPNLNKDDPIVTNYSTIILSSTKDTLDVKTDVNINYVPLMAATIRNITFSIHQLLPKWYHGGFKEAYEFIDKFAWRRFKPTLSYLFFSWLLIMVYKKKQRSLLEKIENIEDQKALAIEQLHNLQDDVEDIQRESDKIAALKEQLEEAIKEKNKAIEKSHSKTKSSENELIRRKDKLEDAIQKLREAERGKRTLEQKLEELQIVVKKKREEHSRLEKKTNHKDFDQAIFRSIISDNKLGKVLLSNPTVNKKDNNNILEIKKGKHGSKDFVKSIGNKLVDNKIIIKYVSDIRSCKYNPYKKGKICISQNEHKQFIAHFYHFKDEGYGALVVFSTKNLYSTVALVKYIVHSISFMTTYKIEVKG